MSDGEYVARCCVVECEKDAEFDIFGDSNHFEDNTQACEAHVGTLLGTPDWVLAKRGRETREWTVVPIDRTHFRPQDIWEIEPTGWHYEESGAPILACYTKDCDSPYHVDEVPAQTPEVPT